MLSSQWLYYVLVVSQGLLIVVSHYSGVRESVRTEMNQQLMGWFVKMTNIDVFVSFAMILMIETFYEVFLNAWIGLTILFKVPAVALKYQDWISISSNVLVWFFITGFLFTTLWYTYTVRMEQRTPKEKR